MRSCSFNCKRFAGAWFALFARLRASFSDVRHLEVGRSPTCRLVRSSTGVAECEKAEPMQYLVMFLATILPLLFAIYKWDDLDEQGIPILAAIPPHMY